MFEKSKVKSYSRLSKSKSGFKVVRVKDFLRKKDDNDNTVRNTVLGVAAISALGIGTALLLKKKGGIKFPGQVNKTNPLAKQKEVERKVDDFINRELEKRQNNIPKSSLKPTKTKEEWIKDIENQKRTDRGDITERPGNPVTIIEEIGVGKKKVNNVVTPKTQLPTKSKFPQVEDPWILPIAKPSSKGSKLLVKKNIKDRSIKKLTEKVVQETNIIKSLPPAKSRLKPEPRGNLLKPKSNSKVEESLANMRNTQKNYDSLPLPMKVTLQIEKALTRPIKSSSLGKQLDTKGLKVILGDSEKLPIEKVISKAKRKVGDRLKRQNEELAKKNLMT